MTGGTEKPKPETPLSGTFPDPIIHEILTRLPAKPLTRFKCVSKRWLSYISSPPFILSVISRSSPSWAMMDHYTKPTSSPTDPDIVLSLSSPPDISHLSLGPNSFANLGCHDSHLPPSYVISSSNGLILFTVTCLNFKERKKDTNSFGYAWHDNFLFVYNPVTHQWAGLGKADPTIGSPEGVGFLTKVNWETSDVRFMAVEYQPLNGMDKASLLTYDSDTCRWELVPATCHLSTPWMHVWRHDAAFEFEGNVFWVYLGIGLVVLEDPFSSLKREGGGERVELKFIPLPDGHLVHHHTPGLEKTRSIDNGGGFIQYTHLDDDGQLRLWRLSEGYEEWNLVYNNVGVMDIWSDQIHFTGGLENVGVCLTSPFDADVLVFKVGNKLVCVNVKEKKVLAWAKFTKAADEGLYLFPMVVPTWPAPSLCRFRESL